MLVRFEQDPSAPPGAGTFFTDDGRSLYGQDPDMAQKLTSAPQLDPGIAQAAMEDPSKQLLASAGSMGSQGSAGSTGSAGSVGSQGSQGSQPESRVDAGGPVQPQAAPLGQVNVGPITTAGAEPPMTPEMQEQVNQARYAQSVIKPAAGGVAHPARMLPKGQTVTEKFEGAPYDQEGVDRRAGLNEGVRTATMQEALNKFHQQEGQAAQYQSQALKLQQKAAEQQSQRDVKQADYEQARSDLQLAMDDTASMKINPDRWFQERGTFGGIAAALAQAIGARAAVRGHTENFAGKFIQDQVNADIAAQRSDIENGKAKSNNALKMLELKLGDRDKAEDALRIIQTNAVDREMKMQAALTQRQDIVDSANRWSAEDAKKNNATEESLKNKYMGEKTVSQTQAYQAASAGGPGKVPPPEELVKKRDAMLQLGMSPEAIDAAFKSQYGFAPGPGKEQNVDSKLVIQSLDGTQVAARTEAEAVKVREKYALYQKVKPSIDGLRKAAGMWKQLSPDQQAAFGLNFEVTSSLINTSLGQNSMKDDDFKRWRGYLAQGGLGAQRAIDEVSRIAENSYQADVDAQRGAAVNEDYRGGKPRTSYTGKGAHTPTVTPKSAEVIE